MLSILLLGSPQVLADQRPLDVLRRKNRALLYFVATHDHALTRDQLLAFLWPDHERAAAQKILRTMLADLRKQLAPALLVQDEHVGLAPGVMVDAHRFAGGLMAADATAATLSATLALYRGDFLEGFTLAEPPEYDDWIAAQREHYRALAIRALTRLAQLHEANGRYTDALEALTRALAFDPLQEDVQRACLRLHYRMGDRAGAVRRYEALVKLLDAEMGVPPMPETRALYDALITDRLPPAVSAPVATPLSASVPPVPAAYDDQAALSPAPRGSTPLLPFIGRAAERQTLQRLAATNQLILIEGEAGIGKTRLAEEFVAAQASATDPGGQASPPLVLRGAAHGLEQGLPYQPLIDALRGLLAHPDWPRLRAGLELSPLWLVEVARLIPELRAQSPALPETAPAPDESRLWEGVHQFLVQLASVRRVIILLDDLHWADASTISLLGYVVRRAPRHDAPASAEPGGGQLRAPRHDAPASAEPGGEQLRAPRHDAPASAEPGGGQLRAPRHDAPASAEPGGGQLRAPRHDAPASAEPGGEQLRAVSPGLLFLATTRPFDAGSELAALLQSLIRAERVARLALSPLSAADARDVAERLSPAHSEPLAQWLARHAEGNAYYLTELVRYAYANGILHRDGSLAPDALASLVVLPQSVQSLIESRLARLSAEARRVLELASVVGPQFDLPLLVQSAEQSESAVLDACDELRAAGLIQPRAGERFAFDHSLTMEVVYRAMSESRYRAQHRRVAQTLEAGYAGGLSGSAEQIAYHFDKGGAPARAAPYAFRAGQSAAALAAWAEAIAFYEQALRATTEDERRFTLNMALGEARFHRGDFPAATESYQAALAIAQAQPDLAHIEAAHLALTLSLVPQSRFAEAIALGEALRRAGPPQLALCAEFVMGVGLAIESAHPAAAEAHLLAAERLLDAPSGYASRVSRAQIKYQLAAVRGQLGNSQGAVALYWEALNLVRADETTLDLLRHIMLYNNLAYHLHLLGDPAAADYARAGIKLARERGSLSHLPYLLSTSGEIALAGGDLDAAERFFDEGLALAERVPLPERIAGLKANLALVAAQRGRTPEAVAYLRDALARATALGTLHLAVRIRLWLAPLLPPAEAQPMLAEARAIAERESFGRLLDDIAAQQRSYQP